MAEYGCDCGAAQKLSELKRINKSWYEEYSTLHEKYKRLEDKYYKEITSRLQDNEDNEDKIENEEDDDEHSCGRKPSDSSDTEEITLKKTDDNIEVLKQQLIVYKEDFLQEQQENKHLQKENQMLKTKIHEQNNSFELLAKKKDVYKRNFEMVNKEKQYICDELKRLSLSRPPSAHYLN